MLTANAASVRVADDVGAQRRPYRADIDGLRALAVLPVVLFHAGVPGWSGGFVGVDIFFVISGYLITGLLYRDAVLGRLNIVAFYERRIRRIFPALFAVLLATSVGAVAILLPRELVDFGKSLFATTVFASNILFWRQGGYFDQDSISKPLLHTWSLAIEEQFYIFFPLIVWAVCRWRPGSLKPALLTIAVISLALSVAILPSAPGATFYLLPSRAWEMIVGSLLAVVPLAKGRVRQPLAVAGVLAILVSVAVYREDMPFPGFAAVLPCLGAAAIIYAAEGTIVGSALSTPLVRTVGLISYSLYLWHWPIIVYSRMVGWGPSTVVRGLVITGLSICVAWCSWRFIEQPFRKRATNAQVFRFAGLCIVAGSAIGVGLVSLDGAPGRFSVVAVAAAEQGRRELQGLEQAYGCATVPFEGMNGFGPCQLGPRGGDLKIVIFGDSHAMALHDSLDRVFLARGLSGTLISSAGCSPLLNLDRVGYGTPCREQSERVWRYLAEVKPSGIVLIGAWRGSLYSKNSVYRNRVSHDDATRLANIADALSDTVRTLHSMNINVGFAFPVPGGRESVPEAIARNRTGIEWTLGEYHAAFDPLTEAAFAAGVDVTADLAAPFCSTGGVCIIKDAGGALYMDSSHVNAEGGRLVQRVLDHAVGELEKQRVH